MESSYTLKCWYEMHNSPHEYSGMSEGQIEELIQLLKTKNAEPGIKNRVLRYEVLYVLVNVVADGVF